MIGRGEITKQAQIDRVDAQTVERDYILAHVAIEISAGGGEQMVLKGGTSLRLVHYENYRYSADLDYSLIGISIDQAFEIIAAALKRCRDQIGIDTLELDFNATPTSNHLHWAARCQTAIHQARPRRRRTRHRTPINTCGGRVARSTHERLDSLLHVD